MLVVRDAGRECRSVGRAGPRNAESEAEVSVQREIEAPIEVSLKPQFE